MKTQEHHEIVLAIDDSRDIHRLLAVRLRGEGMEVRSALTGEAGLEAARALSPQVILLDIDLPGIDGFELLRELKQDSRTRDIPVIMLSASSRAEDKVVSLDLGAVDYVAKPFDHYELVARVRAALRTKRLLDMLAQRAQIDGLTGLWNRAHFDRKLEEAVAEAERHGRPLALAICDLDHFKEINDTFGHPAGDEALTRVAATVQAQLRTEDLAFRVGGEEIALILRGCDASQALTLLKRLQDAVSSIVWPRHPERRITFSCGIVDRARLGVAKPPVWFDQADKALYEAKRGGRNRIVVRGAAPPDDQRSATSAA